MSAALLREAAALMRERAEAATPGPWEAYSGTGQVAAAYGSPADGVRVLLAGNPRNSDHAAAWHPLVALAVADWLEISSRAVQVPGGPGTEAALAVARAYLGRDA